MNSQDRMANILKALGDDLRLRVAFFCYTATHPTTITEMRSKLGWPNEIAETTRIRRALGALADAGVLVKRTIGPGCADEYEVNPEYASELLAFLHSALT